MTDDISVLIVFAESTFSDVAKQASGLAMGLQNIAPTDKANSPNKSVMYLSEVADFCADHASKCRLLTQSNEAEQKERLQEYIHSAVAKDIALREQYGMGEKFRFIRERLEAVQVSVEEEFKSLTPDERKHKESIASDEMLVYIYLFNAHGVTLSSWAKMLTPDIFYEHSVNRPIYVNKNEVEGFIRRKKSKVQHAYIAIVIKKDDVSTAEGSDNLKDTYDAKLIKVKEGTLKIEKMVTFTHNEIEYVLTSDGQLARKML